MLISGSGSTVNKRREPSYEGFGKECAVWKGAHLGTSVVIQWLRLCTPDAGDPGSIPAHGTRSLMPQLIPGAAK